MTAPRLPQVDPELRDKLLFTALAVLVYRVGAHITAPVVNVQVLSDFIKNSAGTGTQTLFSLYDALGGGLSRATIFALGIMPYISASIVFQLGGGVIPTIGKMQKDEEGRKKLTQWTRYLTVRDLVLPGLHVHAVRREHGSRGNSVSGHGEPVHHGVHADCGCHLRDVAG